MPDLSSLGTAVFWKYAPMPFISGIVGYITNRVAIWMMFHPIEFFGVWKPLGGWQGIVPRKAAKMASIAVDTITENLLTSAEIFSRLESEQFAQRMKRPLEEMVPELVTDVMATHHPDIWARTPQAARCDCAADSGNDSGGDRGAHPRPA